MRWKNPRTIWKKVTLGTATILWLAVAAQAGWASPAETPLKPRKARRSIPRPEIGSGLDASEMFAVKLAYRQAAWKLVKEASCHELFEGLDLDGVQALSSNRYRQAKTPQEVSRCGGSIVAVTVVGRSEILLCRGFHRLERSEMSAILIHEALHTAGLTEAPSDPEAMSALEITRRVREACSL